MVDLIIFLIEHPVKKNPDVPQNTSSDYQIVPGFGVSCSVIILYGYC